MELNGGMKPLHVWLASIPVSLLVIGITLGITTTQTVDPMANNEQKDVLTFNSVPKLLTLMGQLMIYGTSVPQLFSRMRRSSQE